MDLQWSTSEDQPSISVDDISVVSSYSQQLLCDNCRNENVSCSTATFISPATMYCQECAVNLCHPCSRHHRHIPVGCHTVKPLGWHSIDTSKDLVESSRRGSCDGGSTKRSYRNIKGYIARISEKEGRIIGEMDKICDESRTFLDQVGERERTLHEAGDEIKHYVDATIRNLGKDLSTVKSQANEQLTHIKNQLDVAFHALQSFTIHTSTLLANREQANFESVDKELRPKVELLMQQTVDGAHNNFKPPDLKISTGHLYEAVLKHVSERSPG